MLAWKGSRARPQIIKDRVPSAPSNYISPCSYAALNQEFKEAGSSKTDFDSCIKKYRERQTERRATATVVAIPKASSLLNKSHVPVFVASCLHACKRLQPLLRLPGRQEQTLLPPFYSKTRKRQTIAALLMLLLLLLLHLQQKQQAIEGAPTLMKSGVRRFRHDTKTAYRGTQLVLRHLHASSKSKEKQRDQQQINLQPAMLRKTTTEALAIVPLCVSLCLVDCRLRLLVENYPVSLRVSVSR